VTSTAPSQSFGTRGVERSPALLGRIEGVLLAVVWPELELAVGSGTGTASSDTLVSKNARSCPLALGTVVA
jgi:hypothetical protein